jgi:hypothetical protein
MVQRTNPGVPIVRIVILIAPLLLIGAVLIGCGNGGPQGTLNPDLPVVSIKIDGMS